MRYRRAMGRSLANSLLQPLPSSFSRKKYPGMTWFRTFSWR